MVLLLPFSMVSSPDTLALNYDSTVVKPLTFDKTHIQKYKSDKAFDYTEHKIKNTFWTKVKRWIYDILLSFFKWIFGHKKASGYLSKFIKYIPYISLGILIIVVVKYLFNANFIQLFTDDNAKSEVIYGEDEEIIRKKDIDSLLKDAIDKENYRLAIRFYFLKLLKKLEDNKVIKWESQKTNYEYLKSIKHKEYKDRFKVFTLWYDYIWYGKYPLNHIEFSNMSKEFDSFFKKLAK